MHTISTPALCAEAEMFYRKSINNEFVTLNKAALGEAAFQNKNCQKKSIFWKCYFFYSAITDA